MGTYNIPRNLRGESRILYIFTIKALITTAGGAFIGLIFYLPFSMIGMGTVGLIIAGAFALIRLWNRFYKNTNNNSTSIY